MVARQRGEGKRVLRLGGLWVERLVFLFFLGAFHDNLANLFCDVLFLPCLALPGPRSRGQAVVLDVVIQLSHLNLCAFAALPGPRSCGNCVLFCVIATLFCSMGVLFLLNGLGRTLRDPVSGHQFLLFFCMLSWNAYGLR